MQDKVWSDFNSLPLPEQRQVADFIAFLRQRSQRSAPGKRNPASWEEEPFVGMWRDREEMVDSVEWVRRTREQEWGEPGG